MLYNISKEFIKNFSIPLDFDVLGNYLSQISKINCDLHNCDADVVITFDESMLFGKSGSVKDNHISFNKTRIETLFLLKIDSNDKKHINRVYEFYNNFDEKKNNSVHEKSLFEFMKKYIENGYERYFSQMGSYKTIKYELLDTIFHENEHIFQRKYETYFEDVEKCPTDNKSFVLVFTMFFNKIYEELLKSNMKFDCKRENYIFPIEFDARYAAMVNLNQLREKYFSDDKLFAQYIVQSSLIPEKFNAKQIVTEMFKDYENLYSLFEKFNINNFTAVNTFICKNKELIINELLMRYIEMMTIVESNKFIMQ